MEKRGARLRKKRSARLEKRGSEARLEKRVSKVENIERGARFLKKEVPNQEYDLKNAICNQLPKRCPYKIQNREVKSSRNHKIVPWKHYKMPNQDHFSDDKMVLVQMQGPGDIFFVMQGTCLRSGAVLYLSRDNIFCSGNSNPKYWMFIGVRSTV